MGLGHDVPIFELFRADRRALDLERQMLMENPSRKANLSSSRDSYGALSSQRTALEREPFLCLGRVGDSIPYTHFYKTRLYRQGGIIPCCMATQTSLELMGAKQINNLVPETQVVVMWAPHMPFGIILGVVPDFTLSPQDALGDRIVQGSRVGLNIDSFQNYAFNLVMGGGIIDWSSGRPNDQVDSGEWGATTETGLMFFLDPFMMMMRVDEETGVFGFYDDQMLRVAGHNLHISSSGYERTDDDDEWEFNIIEECVPGYLWEGRGAYERPRVVHRVNTTEDVQVNIPWYSELEPFDDHQQPIRRYRKFMGYLGQGYKRTLFLLPEPGSPDRDEEIPNLQKITDLTRFPGVAEEQWGLDGFISQRSAKGIVLSKRMLIPEPKRIRLEEDTSGDTSTNYKQDGVFGSGAAHKVGDITYPSCVPTNLLQAAAFFDLYAHVFNWRGLHPFHYHEKDFYMPQEDDYWFAAQMVRGNPPFADCRSPSLGMLAPMPLMFTVDERYGQIMYFPNNSYIALLDDGGIVIGDGYGAEERMVAGNIMRTAPNDIYDLPGKNYACWAGRDFVARANWNAHLVANNCNVFIKAENKTLIMGGNDKCGGVLIESKSPKTQFETETPVNYPPKCSIAQSGGFRNSIVAVCNCAAYVPPNLKEVYRICCTVGGAPGAALFNVISFSGTDNVIGMLAPAFAAPTAIGVKGCLATWTSSGDNYIAGQEWTLSVTNDANDLNDETIAGVIVRAKESTVFTYASNIENLLSHDGIGGTMIFDAGRNGFHVSHGKNVIRHIEKHADDIFWTTSPPSYVVLFESTAATKDETYYFGPDCVYTITCIAGNFDQPLNAARVSVVSSLGDDSDDSVVVANPGKLTAIGNRGFRWRPDVANIVPGNSWVYMLHQTFTACVNHWDKDTAVLCQNICVENLVAECVMATKNITSLETVIANGFDVLTEEDEAIVMSQVTDCENVHNAHVAWAPTARHDLTTIKDSTKVTKMEFFFPSSFQSGTEPPWKLFESRWQQMDRNQSMSAVNWTENPVVGADAACFVSVTFYPWPGKYSWKVWDTYFKENVNLFQLSNNLLLDRGAPYETPVAYNPPTGSAFDGQWKIIENPC